MQPTRSRRARRGNRRPGFLSGEGISRGSHAAPTRRGHGCRRHRLAFVPPRGARINGLAVLSSGEPVNGTALLRVSARSGLPIPQPQTVRITGGRFEFHDVAPGDYVLQVLGKREWLVSEEFGAHSVAIRDAVTTSVNIRTSAGSTLAGKIVFEDAEPPATTSGVKLAAYPTDPDATPVAGVEPTLAQHLQIRPNWTFELNNVFGPNRVSATVPDGWWLKSITVGGTNVADEPFPFGQMDRTQTDVEVVLARGTATLSGRALDGTQPVADYSVVAFSTDPSRIFPRSRHMGLARPDQDGRFTLSQLPPGDYWVAAVDAVSGDATSGEWQTPEVLNSLLPSARRVTVGRGQSATVDLRLVRLPR